MVLFLGRNFQALLIARLTDFWLPQSIGLVGNNLSQSLYLFRISLFVVLSTIPIVHLLIGNSLEGHR